MGSDLLLTAWTSDVARVALDNARKLCLLMTQEPKPIQGLSMSSFLCEVLLGRFAFENTQAGGRGSDWMIKSEKESQTKECGSQISRELIIKI